jgi:hypothetical protein
LRVARVLAATLTVFDDWNSSVIPSISSTQNQGTPNAISSKAVPFFHLKSSFAADDSNVQARKNPRTEIDFVLCH